MRGYNESDKPEGVEPYRMHQLATDIAGVVKALGHETCTLVAHDWGGCVCWTVAGMYGSKLLDRLIIMGLPHLGEWRVMMGEWVVGWLGGWRVRCS